MATPTLYPAYYDKANDILIYQDLGTTIEIPVGSGATVYGPYASNAAAIADGREAGDLYKSVDTYNGSPFILITV